MTLRGKARAVSMAIGCAHDDAQARLLKAFRPRGGTGRRYLLDNIPSRCGSPSKKATRDGVSIRALILTLLQDWLQAGDAMMKTGRTDAQTSVRP